jgi:beta-glucosidase
MNTNHRWGARPEKDNVTLGHRGHRLLRAPLAREDTVTAASRDDVRQSQDKFRMLLAAILVLVLFYGGCSTRGSSAIGLQPTSTAYPSPSPTAPTRVATSIPVLPALWQAATAVPLLRRGYLLLAPGEGSDADPAPHPIPGRIEAEDYDVGGEGVAYHDTTPGNAGGQYRSDDVDIEITTDVGGGYNVSHIEQGEWLQYTVHVVQSADYDLQVRVASAASERIEDTVSAVGPVSWTVPVTRTLHVELDGVGVSGPLTFVATGGWQNWTSVFARRIPLPEGRHVLRIAMDADLMNVNWIWFRESPAETGEALIDHLIEQMTVAEKIGQLHGSDWMDTVDNLRLFIPGFRMADGPHGVRGGQATSFPVGIAMAATWDPELIEWVGRAMGDEFQGKGRSQALGPCLDITRDPRNGRSPESGGEEPYLIGKIGAAMVKGIQSAQTIATAKHDAATNHQDNRRYTNHWIDARTVREFYGLPFRMAVQQGDAWSVMNAYNWINGRPSSANRELLTQMLREEWGYRYYVVSDWGSIYTPAAQALTAGCDLEMPHMDGRYSIELPAAIASGEVLMATLDQAVRRVLRTKLAAGLLGEVPPGNPDDVCSPEHRDLALEVAQKGIVLLKNEGGILPLDRTQPMTIALIGPSATVAQLDGSGSSVVEPCYAVTPRQGILDRTAGYPVTLTYVKGCDINSDDRSGFPAAVAAARNADVVIYVGGLDNTQEGEEIDRASQSVQLPGQQPALINALAAANSNTIVVLKSGGIVALQECIDNIKGLVYAFYPGQEGGNAIADVLFGNVNPGGKLPVTMPRSDDQLPDWNDLDFSGDESPTADRRGFGYRWFDRQADETPQYPFGYGLSYTTFKYDHLILASSSTTDAPSVAVSVDVINVGDRAGDEVVQLYCSVEFTGARAREIIAMPVKRLCGFKRLTLAPGQSETITLVLGPEELSFWSISDDSFRVEAGTYTVQGGGSSGDLPLSGIVRLTSSRLYNSATGETSPARHPVFRNLALDRPVTCSSIEGRDTPCRQAVDGRLDTRWSSKFSDPQWIYVDLGSRQHIERVILHWETAFGRAYRVQVSNDKVHWQDVYRTDAGDGEVDNLDLFAAGRYVRVYGEQRGTGWGYSLREVQVYGGASIHLPLVLSPFP